MHENVSSNKYLWLMNIGNEFQWSRSISCFITAGFLSVCSLHTLGGQGLGSLVAPELQVKRLQDKSEESQDDKESHE